MVKMVMEKRTAQRRRTLPARHANQRGSALIEMAIMLPVLVLMFIGMVEFGQFIMMRERMNKVSNQIAGTLYQLNSSQIGSGDIIQRVIDQSPALAYPYKSPSVNVRFCEYGDESKQTTYRLSSSPGRWQHAGTNSKCTGIVEEIGCLSSNSTATHVGHGAFVQVSSCTRFEPLITGRIFEVFGTELEVTTTSYTPLSDANQTALLAQIGGGRAVENGGGSNPIPDPDPDPVDEPPFDDSSCDISACPAPSVLRATATGCSCINPCSVTQDDPGSCSGNTVFDAASCSCVPRNCGENYEETRICGENQLYNEARCRCENVCSNPQPCPGLGQERDGNCVCQQTSCPDKYSLVEGKCVAEAESDSWGDCEDALGDVSTNKCKCPDGSYTDNGICELDTWCPTGQKPDGMGGCKTDCGTKGADSCSAPKVFNPNTCNCDYAGCPDGLQEYTVNGEATCGTPCLPDQYRDARTGACMDANCNPSQEELVGQSCCDKCPAGWVRIQGGSSCQNLGTQEVRSSPCN
jgi:hypothetical protein